MKIRRSAARHFNRLPRLAPMGLLVTLLVTAFPAWAQAPPGAAATPTLEARKQDCEELWREGLAYTQEDLSRLLREIGEDSSRWLPHEKKRLRELTEEMVSIRATLAYCEATFTPQDKMPQPNGILGPVSMPDWGGAGDKPGASDVDFSVLFVSTRCELCRKQVREMNDWILVNLKASLIRHYLWGNFAAPGESQNEAVRRTTNRMQDAAYFQSEYADRIAALRNCEDLYCARQDEDGPAGSGSPAMPGDTATRATPGKEPYKYFTDETHCLHPRCLYLAEQLAQRNPIYTGLMDSIISQEEQLEEAGAALKNCGGCPAAEISRLIKVRDSIYRDLAALRERRQPLWTEMVNLDADLQECEKKWCSRSSIHYNPRYEIDGGQGYRSSPGLVKEVLLGKPGLEALPQSTGPEEDGWGEFSPDLKYTLPGRAFLTRDDPPRVTYPVGANGTAVFDREEKPASRDKAEPAVPRSSQQPGATAPADNPGPHGRLLIGLDDARMAHLAARQPGEVLVAVIDSGADFSHPDLAAALWQNPGERYNYRDDDGNGLIDDISGWNYLAHSGATQDDNGHGTLVAGIIASRGDGDDSVAGVNPWARILPIKVTNGRGDGNSVGVAAAITEAVNRGAKVINVSLGGEQFAAAEETAVRYAHDAGAVVVVAAGNQNSNTRGFWPAGLDNVITVAALDAAGERAAYSNWGSAVDIAAPGSNILSLRAIGADPMALVDEAYETGANVRGENATLYVSSGTSFAAPFVAGAASLLFAVNPELTGPQVRNMLLQSAADIGAPGVDPLTGYGRLDAAAALAADPDFFVTAHITGIASQRRDGALFVTVNGSADASRFAKALVEIGQGDDPTGWQPAAPALTTPVRDAELAVIPASLLRGADRWTIRLTVEHESGRARATRFDLKLK